jgi:phosphatidylglycerophosphate synthase
MTAITLLLWRAFKPNNDIWLMAGYVAMAIAVFLTLWSMWNYLQVMLGKATDNETA